MIGLLLWKLPEKRGRSLRVGERSILHMRFTCAEITRGPKTPEAVLRRRVSAAGKRLRKLGITRAVLPEDFAYQELLERQGIRAVSTVTLRRALAADWARAVMETGALSPGNAKVAVAGSQLTGELVRTVTELSLRNRYVLLDLPYGGEELCRQLRREYGVTLLLSPAKEQLEGADVLLLFDRREDLKPGGVVLPLHRCRRCCCRRPWRSGCRPERIGDSSWRHFGKRERCGRDRSRWGCPGWRRKPCFQLDISGFNHYNKALMIL